MKWIGTLLLLFLYAFAQAQPTPSAIKAAALQMTKAIIHHKNEEIVPFMHPAVIQSAGGTAKALAMLDSANVYMNRFGAKVKRINIGNPGQLFLQQGEWQCIVPQTTWLEMMGNQVKWNAYLIAISHQKGKQWYFIDANLYRAKKSVKGLPALHPDMVIPTVQAPEFIPPQQ